MKKIYSYIVNFLMQYPLLSICIFCVFLFSPSLLLGLFADDLLWLSLYSGERFSHEPYAFKAFFFDAFSFFKGNPKELFDLKVQALVPWWADDALKIQFFRPISAATHWFDFTVFGNHFYWMHIHSIAWFCALLWAIQKWYWVFLNEFIVDRDYFSFDRRKVLFFSLLIFSLDFSHVFPVYWLCNRNIIIASFFIFLSLWCFHCGLFSSHRRRPLGQSSALSQHSSLNEFDQLNERSEVKFFFLHRGQFYLLSLLFYFFAIFSSENTFFLVLFFPVYAYFSRQVSMIHVVGISSAYVIILLLSVVAYFKLGYGVFATDFYIHPLYNIKLYLLSAIEKVPLYWFFSLLGLDGVYISLPYLGKAIVWVVSVFAITGFLIIMRKFIFLNQSILLLIFLINISLIPSVGFSLVSERTLFLASVPFSLFLSCFFFYGCQRLSLNLAFRNFFSGIFIFFHIISSLVRWLVAGYLITQFSHVPPPISLKYDFLNHHSHDAVFILNHPDPLSHLYSNFVFPEHIGHLPYLLGTAFQTMKVTPLSSDAAPCQMKIEFYPQFFYAEHSAHWSSLSRYMNDMRWKQHYFGARAASIFIMEQWEEGDTIEFPAFYIRIQKMRAISNRDESLNTREVLGEDQGFDEVIFGAKTNKTCREHFFYQWDTHLERYDQIFPVESGKEYWLK